MDDDGIPEGSHHLFELTPRRRGAPGAEEADAPLVPQLQELDSEFRAIAREVRALAQGLSREQFNWRPAIGRWSVAECLWHLNLVGTECLAVVDAGIRDARANGWLAKGPFKVGFLAARFVRATRPPVRLRRRAEPQFMPEADQSVEEAVTAVVDLQAQLLARLVRGSGLDLARIKVRAPGRLLITVTLFDLLCYLAAHEQRHMAQAWRVRRDLRFPKAPAPRSGPTRPRG